MKVLAVLAALVVASSAMPRYLIVPIENVRFMQEPEVLHRVARSAFPEDEREREAPLPLPRQRIFNPLQAVPPISQRRQEEATPAFVIPQTIRATEDALASGSSPSYKANAGPDYVDYGAYTGGYGAFGWYTDHPVLIVDGKHGYH